MSRYRLTDDQWALIAPLMPRAHGAGHPWREHRPLFDAILWVLHTGAPWRDLPPEFGPWETAFYRFNRWRREGLLDRLAHRLQLQLDRNGQIDWSQGALDGTSVRAGKAAAGAVKRGVRGNRWTMRWGVRGEAGARRSISLPTR